MKNVSLSYLFLHFFFCVGLSQVVEPIESHGIPLLKHFESADYNGGIQNWSMDQDSLGILYVANNSGLLEFDGSQWKKHVVPFCTKVRAVMVDKENRIFVGGQGQIGYYSMSNIGLEFTSLLNLLPSNYQSVAEVWRILEHDGKIFINTESQLLMYDYNEIKVIQEPKYVRFAFTVEDRLFAQFYNMGLFEFIDNEFVSVKGTEFIPEVVSVLPKDDELFYFCSSGEIFRHYNNDLEELQFPIDFGSINHAVNLSSGDFAVATQNKGLYLFDSEMRLKQNLTKNKGLTDRTVRIIYEDGFRNLWLGLNNGIDYLKLNLPLTLINEEVGLKGAGYAACRFKDQIYFGTSNGVFIGEKTNDLNEQQNYNLIPGSEGQIYQFSQINDELLINHNKGGFQLVNGKAEQFHDIGSWKFLSTTSPNIILGGDYQGISFFKKTGNKWSKTHAISGLYESSRVMEFENDSTLWMTHGYKGAYRLLFDLKTNRVNEIEFFGEKSGFPSNILISVYSLNNQLVFTAENGIYTYDKESNSFKTNPFFTKWLGNEHVGAIASGKDNTIYYIQDLEMGKLQQESFEVFTKETGIFKHINKYINDDLTDITILDEYHILIGAKEGFIQYDPQKKFSTNEGFSVLMREVQINTSVDSSSSFFPGLIRHKEIEKNQAIIFRYAAPFFDGFEDLKYSYRLLPLEESWSKWSPSGEKEYPYLPSGNYTFEVKAQNIYGKESPVSSYSFRVLKPWYFTSWAILSFSFIAFILVSLIPFVQSKKYKTEKSLINRDKDQVINSKNEEIDMISQESKKEIERLVHEKLRTEIDLKNDQLTSVTMHLMKNNEFIQEIKNKIETNIEKGSSTRELQRIINTIDRNLENNDSWDQFAYHFDQVHGGYLKKLSADNIRLSPREIKLASFLRMNMSSKEISKLMNVTVRGVELARYRLRKKLKLERDQSLVEYLIDLDTKE